MFCVYLTGLTEMWMINAYYDKINNKIFLWEHSGPFKTYVFGFNKTHCRLHCSEIFFSIFYCFALILVNKTKIELSKGKRKWQILAKFIIFHTTTSSTHKTLDIPTMIKYFVTNTIYFEYVRNLWIIKAINAGKAKVISILCKFHFLLFILIFTFLESKIIFILT